MLRLARRKLVTRLVGGGAALAVAGTPLVPSGATAADQVTDRHIRDARVTESSGLARSTYPRRVLFTHNDSGDGPRVFAIDRLGNTRAVLQLKGASAADWEDITTGPNHRLWVGDIGDNGRRRDSITVYSFREPKALSHRSVQARRYRLAYPDGARDAEAMMVHPKTGRLFIVSKQRGHGVVYRAPRTLSERRVNVLRPVGRAPEMVTAATWGPHGKRYALSTYTRAYLYRGFKARPVVVRLPWTRQGESLEFGRSPRNLFRGSEGSNSPVYRVDLRQH